MAPIDKTIIFDFDHTLFNTRAFSEIMKNFFLKQGIPEDLYISVFKSQGEKRNGNSDFFELVRNFKDLGFNIPTKEIDNFVNQDMVSCLKGPVCEVLTELKNKNILTIILSKGIGVHQMLKIKQSGIEHFFKDRIYICENHKEKIIKTIPTQGEVYFVNDHADEIETVMKFYPEMKFIYVRGPKTHHDRFLGHKHIKTISDISGLLDILK